MTQRIGTSLALIISATLWTSNAEALSLTVTPAEHRVEMKAGSTETRTLAVTNNGDGPITINAYTWDWWYDESGGHQFAPPGTFQRSGAIWVSVAPESLIIDAGATGHLEVHASMPEQSLGGYYAVAFVEARAGTPFSEGFSMRPGGRIAVPLLMEAKGTPNHGLSLIETVVVPPNDSQALTISLTSKNTGDTHEFPEFMGAIRSVDHQRVVARFRGDPVRMLPGQQRAIEATWSGGLAPGAYEVIGSLVYGGGKSETVRQSFSVQAEEGEDQWLP